MNQNAVPLKELLDDYAVEKMGWFDSDEEEERFWKQNAGQHEYTDKERDDSVNAVLECVGWDNAEVSNQLPLFVEPDNSDRIIENRTTSGGQHFADLLRTSYLEMNDGASIDLVIADPALNLRFIQSCWRHGIQADKTEINLRLLNARKNGLIGKVDGVRRFSIPRTKMDEYLFASEMALRLVQDVQFFQYQRKVSLDRILCDDTLGKMFIKFAKSVAPGFRDVEYRWAAMSVRKSQGRTSGASFANVLHFDVLGRGSRIRPSRISSGRGMYWLNSRDGDLFIGHAEDLRAEFNRLMGLHEEQFVSLPATFEFNDFHDVEFAIAECELTPTKREPIRSELVAKRRPRLNALGISAFRIAS